MQSANVTFSSASGHRIAGTIDFPDSPPKAYAIFAHCFAGHRHTPGAARVSKQLTSFGIACLRFDFPGLGQSEGDFAETSFSENIADFPAAPPKECPINNWGALYSAASHAAAA